MINNIIDRVLKEAGIQRQAIDYKHLDSEEEKILQKEKEKILSLSPSELSDIRYNGGIRHPYFSPELLPTFNNALRKHNIRNF